MAIRCVRRKTLDLVISASLVLLAASAAGAEEPAVSPPAFETLRVTGRVGWLVDAVRTRFGLELVPEAGERTLAITTGTGEVLPLLEDSRGRAFRLDERLRQLDLELLVRRYRQMPVLQVLQILEVASDGSRAELDYWCDICAIAMVELKSCECCQGPTELRRRPVPR